MLTFWGFFLLATVVGAEFEEPFDPLKWVDPLIGSQNGGNVFAGASIPYGMAKPVADTDDPSNQGGFVFSKSNVTGFSNLHDSGTGGSPSLGNFALFPHPYCSKDDVNGCVFPKRTRKIPYVEESVVAEPGYFSITLANNVTVSMTSTHHTSMFIFEFPESDGHPLILLDLTDLSDSRMDNGTMHVVVGETTARMTGGAVFRSSFSTGAYTAYFCADYRGGIIKDTGIFSNSRASKYVKDLTISRSINGYPLPGGGFIRFMPGARVKVRVGLSFISAEQACENAEREVPTFDFDGVKEASQKMWRKKLAPIRIDSEGVDESFVKIFYSGIYRTLINPQDYTGENPLWESAEPYFDSFYCLWDSFRSQIPFLTLLDPSAVTRMVRGLIDIWKHDGWLPDCRMSFSRGYTQGGSNADVILADALLKIPKGIDWDLGYKAVVKDAEEEPFDWCCRGRGGLDSWKSLGYIPVQDFDYKGFGTMTRSISRTLEYSYNDFTIAEMAYKLGYEDDANIYLERSQNWKNLFNPNTSSSLNGRPTGHSGFFQPKYLNQTWGYQDPFYCSQLDTNPQSVCSLQNTAGETFESSIWEYGFYVPHDQAGLMSFYGGPAEFISRLDYLHDKSVGDISNEPAFLTIFQYHYAGRPGLSAKRSHFYIGEGSRFTDEKDGVPGNDDSGAMGSFAAFNMMGFFPNPGQDVYFIIPPYFREVQYTSPVGNATATIRVENFDPTYKAVFIQNATLDGEPYTRNWITHDFFRRGGELVLTVGTKESNWGTRVEDVPPSLSSYPDLKFNASMVTGSVMDMGKSKPRGKAKGAMGHIVEEPGRPRGVRTDVKERDVKEYWARDAYR